MKVLYLDESGDHDLRNIQPDYPVFVLGGVIVDLDYTERVVEPEFNALKRRLFGTTDIILHTADIVRNRNGFERMKEPDVRDRFRSEINRLLSALEFKVVACAIKKFAHRERYGWTAIDPYLLSLNILVERLCFEVGRHGTGMIVAERRNAELDHQLELAWLDLKVSGTEYLSGRMIEERVEGLRLLRKAENNAGLQLADLVVSPIGRHVIGKRDNEDYRIVESKFRRDDRGRYIGRGLVILPK